MKAFLALVAVLGICPSTYAACDGAININWVKNASIIDVVPEIVLSETKAFSSGPLAAVTNSSGCHLEATAALSPASIPLNAEMGYDIYSDGDGSRSFDKSTLLLEPNQDNISVVYKKFTFYWANFHFIVRADASWRTGNFSEMLTLKITDTTGQFSDEVPVRLVVDNIAPQPPKLQGSYTVSASGKRWYCPSVVPFVNDEGSKIHEIHIYKKDQTGNYVLDPHHSPSAEYHLEFPNNLCVDAPGTYVLTYTDEAGNKSAFSSEVLLDSATGSGDTLNGNKGSGKGRK